jgi:hypothetical protein
MVCGGAVGVGVGEGAAGERVAETSNQEADKKNREENTNVS